MIQGKKQKDTVTNISAENKTLEKEKEMHEQNISNKRTKQSLREQEMNKGKRQQTTNKPGEETTESGAASSRKKRILIKDIT